MTHSKQAFKVCRWYKNCKWGKVRGRGASFTFWLAEVVSVVSRWTNAV